MRGPPGEPASGTAPLSRAVVIGEDAQFTTAAPGELPTATPAAEVRATGASSREEEGEEEKLHTPLAELELAWRSPDVTSTAAPDVEVASSREEEETSLLSKSDKVQKLVAEQAAADEAARAKVAAERAAGNEAALNQARAAKAAASRKEVADAPLEASLDSLLLEVATDDAPLPQASLVETGPGAASLAEQITGAAMASGEHAGKGRHRHYHEEPPRAAHLPAGVSTRREKALYAMARNLTATATTANLTGLNLTAPTTDAPLPPVAASVLEQTAKGAAEPAEAGTLAIPRYVYQLPVPLDLLKEGDGYKLRVMERFTVPVLLPWWLAYTYVPMAFALFGCLWCLFCRREQKFDLSLGPLCETMFCFMCMWAHRVSSLQLITAKRAWGWVLGLAAVLSAWHIVDAALKATKASEAAVQVCFYAFQGTFLLLWLGFASERMQIRKLARRTADPMAGDAQCGDCTVELCCPQLTALQETVFLAAQGDNASAKSLTKQKTGGTQSLQSQKTDGGKRTTGQPQLW